MKLLALTLLVNSTQAQLGDLVDAATNVIDGATDIASAATDVADGAASNAAQTVDGKMCPGCLSEQKPVVFGSTDHTFLLSTQAKVEAETGKKYTVFVPKYYKTQVVNGIRYEALIQIGEKSAIQINVIDPSVGDEIVMVSVGAEIEFIEEGYAPVDKETEKDKAADDEAGGEKDEDEEWEGAEADCAGCWTDMTEPTDAEDIEYFKSLQSMIEDELDTKLTTLKPILFSSQVVAGMKFNIVYEIDGEDGTAKIEVEALRSLAPFTTTLKSVKAYSFVASAAFKAEMEAEEEEEEEEDDGALKLAGATLAMGMAVLAQL